MHNAQRNLNKTHFFAWRVRETMPTLPTNRPFLKFYALVCAGEGILEKGRLVGKVGGMETNKCPVPFTSYVQIWKCKGS